MSLKNYTTLIVPGLRDHVEQHWQTLLSHQLIKQGVKTRTVPPLETDKLSLAARVNAIQHELAQIEGPVILVAHSGGCMMVAHWALQSTRPIHAALLAAPADLETPLPAGYPVLDDLQAKGWLPVPRQRLPFRSIVVASTNDPLARLERTTEFARDWGSELVNAGAVGHLNPASGHGEWPMALELIETLAS